MSQSSQQRGPSEEQQRQGSGWRWEWGYEQSSHARDQRGARYDRHAQRPVCRMWELVSGASEVGGLDGRP